MGDSPNNRYVTRSAGIPAQLAEASTTIKQEPLDEAVPHGHAKEPNTANFQEASSSNCSSRDPLADEMEFGETSLSFQNAFFNVVGNEIKTENIIADEIEDSGDIVGSSKFGPGGGLFLSKYNDLTAIYLVQVQREEKPAMKIPAKIQVRREAHGNRAERMETTSSTSKDEFGAIEPDNNGMVLPGGVVNR
uniref:Uncharacterized protein n=1 Tax=Anopheles culicifacies TaxID=139723 RepID=A0A182M3E5_9DIPT